MSLCTREYESIHSCILSGTQIEANLSKPRVVTVVMAGPPARLTLTADPDTFEAARDSVAIIRADSVDSEGHHVYGATNTLQWSVSGPATLIGPPVYSTDTDKYEAMEGTMYIDCPTFNIVRSTGKPGEIRVRVLSPGLASTEVRILATAVPEDISTAIVEPALPETDRQPVARESHAVKRDQVAAQEMSEVSEDLRLSVANLAGYGRQIDEFLREKNPTLDFAGPEYQAVVSALGALLQNNRGSLVRDDFNFTVRFYNDCRQITREIATLDVPPLFKQALRAHYAHVMIEQGEAKDYDAEVRWLASLPTGKLVVSGVPVDTTREPDVLYTDRCDLATIVTLALPEFKRLNSNRQAALLDVICALNPSVERKVVRTGGEKVNGVRQKTVETVSYEVARKQPVLVPGMKYLEEQTRGRED